MKDLFIATFLTTALFVVSLILVLIYGIWH